MVCLRSLCTGRAYGYCHAILTPRKVAVGTKLFVWANLCPGNEKLKHRQYNPNTRGGKHQGHGPEIFPFCTCIYTHTHTNAHTYKKDGWTHPEKNFWLRFWCVVMMKQWQFSHFEKTSCFLVLAPSIMWLNAVRDVLRGCNGHQNTCSIVSIRLLIVQLHYSVCLEILSFDRRCRTLQVSVWILQLYKYFKILNISSFKDTLRVVDFVDSACGALKHASPI